MLIVMPATPARDRRDSIHGAIQSARQAMISALDSLAEGLSPEEVLTQPYGWVKVLKKMLKAEKCDLEELLYGDFNWVMERSEEALTQAVIDTFEALLDDTRTEHRFNPWDEFTRIIHIPENADESLYAIRFMKVLTVDKVLEVR